MCSEKKTFIDLCLDGQADLSDINDFVDAWHEGDDDRELNEYLGMSDDEYEMWIKNPTSIRHILYCRRFGESINHSAGTEDELPFAARASSVKELQEIQEWLANRKRRRGTRD
ncbi:MAG: hypothetical protein VB122_08525 [Erysipelotrichales bacterium]|nr:hypothetical protein [Erysipelotrichales bacterium]